MLLTEAIELTRRCRETWRPGAKGYMTTIYNTNWCVEILNNPKIQDIRPLHIVEMQSKLINLGKSPATVNRICQALRTILNTARKMEVIDKVPHYDQLREPPGRTFIYTDEQEQLLYRSALKLRNNAQLIHSILRFAFLTGARQGEIVKLQWDAINFEKNTITFFDTKTSHNRVLPMPPTLRELMERLYHERVDNTVFDISKDRLIYYWKQLKKKAGITEKDACFHSIRHTVCSRLWSKGCAQPDIMAVMGHTLVETTRRYSHATEEGIGNALALL